MQQNYFYIIPAELAESGNPTKAMLYGLVMSLTNNTGVCTASNKYLAKKLGKKSDRIISKYIKELEEEGWIVTEITEGFNRKISTPLAFKYRGGRNKTRGGTRLNARGVAFKRDIVLEDSIINSIKETKNKNSYKDGDKLTLEDGTEAVKRFGVWVDASNPNVTIDASYYRLPS